MNAERWSWWRVSQEGRVLEQPERAELLYAHRMGDRQGVILLSNTIRFLATHPRVIVGVDFTPSSLNSVYVEAESSEVAKAVYSQFQEAGKDAPTPRKVGPNEDC